MPKSIFSEAGIAVVSFLLIIAGIILTTVEDMLRWGEFCISLGGCVIFFILASKAKGSMQIILNIIGGVALVAAIVFFVKAV